MQKLISCEPRVIFDLKLLKTEFHLVDKYNKTVRFWGKSDTFFGSGTVTIKMFEKKMFQIMCHMMGCNDSSG